MDTINSTLAHGPETRLPKEFYEAKGRAIIDKIGVEEWFSGYQESQEYRALGIGGLMGDIVTRMVGSVEHNGNDGSIEIGGEAEQFGGGQESKAVKLALSGCHDTTLAGVLASLGTFQGEPWPPYTSHIALELFRKADAEEVGVGAKRQVDETGPVAIGSSKVQKAWFGGMFGGTRHSIVHNNETKTAGIARKRIEELSESERLKLDGYFVRIRYNDKVMKVPGCRPAGKHLEGDESFCTLVSKSGGRRIKYILTIYKRRLLRLLLISTRLPTGSWLASTIWKHQHFPKGPNHPDTSYPLRIRDSRWPYRASVNVAEFASPPCQWAGMIENP